MVQTMDTGQAKPLLRAAQYLRMSTESQVYSLACQQETIAAYAAWHGMEVVQSYVDSGKSGLTLTGRAGLGQMLSDVIKGISAYELILVYDVSRWGRFQDTDESGHYEFLCRQAGILVRYCAEMFDNDGSPLASIMKAIKRSMAGEFSRDLSVKTTQGQAHATTLGFWRGGPAPYGYRRFLLDRDGRPKQVLEAGDRKSLTDNKVVLVLGPDAEVKTVRLIFNLYARQGLQCNRIARMLNRRGVASPSNGQWAGTGVHNILENEAYLGTALFGKTSRRLGTKTIKIDPSLWIRKENAFPAIVPRELFDLAGLRFKRMLPHPSKAAVFAKLNDLLARKGKLTLKTVASEADMPTMYMVKKHFGSFLQAYEELGYVGPLSTDAFGLRDIALRVRREVLGNVTRDLREHGYSVKAIPNVAGVIVEGRVRVTVTVSRVTRTRKGSDPVWAVRTDLLAPSDALIVVRFDGRTRRVLDYYLLPRAPLPKFRMWLPSPTKLWCEDCCYPYFGDLLRVLRSSYLAHSGTVRL
jgi:DNA invertase Pin-like site-specific DNA recombinase